MSFVAENNLRTITGRQTTAGAAEETVNLSLDGAVAAATIAVAANVTMLITDVIVTAEAATRFRLQQANDGVTFFDIALWRQSADGSGGFTGLNSPLRIAGSATAVIRLRAETPGGAAAVTATVRGYTTTTMVNS